MTFTGGSDRWQCCCSGCTLQVFSQIVHLASSWWLLYIHWGALIHPSLGMLAILRGFFTPTVFNWQCASFNRCMWPLWLQLFSYELLFWGRGQKLYMQENAFFRLFFFFSEEGRSMKEKCMFALHNAINAINMACQNMACRTIFCMLYNVF